MINYSRSTIDHDRHQYQLPQLFREYAHTRDVALRNRLVLLNEPLARCIAARFKDTGGSTKEDLGQVACIGLVAAIERFQPDSGRVFASFAVPTIVGVIRNHLRDRGWLIKVPREIRELGRSAAKASALLEVEQGRPPSVPEVAQRLGVSPERLLEALELGKAYQPGSFDLGVLEEASDHLHVLGVIDRGYSEIETRETIWASLEFLPPRERNVIELRFFHDLSQAAVASRMRLSQMHISRLERRALARLRAILSEPDRVELDIHRK